MGSGGPEFMRKRGDGLLRLVRREVSSGALQFPPVRNMRFLFTARSFRADCRN